MLEVFISYPEFMCLESMRNNRAVRVYISDPRILKTLITMLNKEGIPFTELTANIISNGDIVITNNLQHTIKYLRGKRVYIVEANRATPEYLTNVVEKVKCLLRGKDRYRTLILGIDPGVKIGLVILGDNELCKATVFNSVEDLISTVKLALLNMPYERARVRIGNGEKSARVVNEILNFIEKYKSKELKEKEIVIELVDETRTYNIPAVFKGKMGNIPKDVISALNIAVRRGLVIEGIEYS